MILAARLLRQGIRALVVHGRPVGIVERAARFVLLSPLMLTWLALRWMWIMSGRRVEDEGTSRERIRMRCSLVDMIQMFIYLFGVWEPDLSAFIKRRLQAGDVYVDVGANVGAFALLAATCVGGAGRVAAIEASPKIADRLRRNLALNGTLAGVVDVIEAAAAAEEGVITIYRGPSKNEGMTTALSERGLREEGAVRAAPVEALVGEDVLRRARLIKVDVEGAERDVLAGLAGSIDKLSGDVEIMVEFSPHWWKDRRPDVAAVLAPYLRAGFKAYSIENNYWPWRYLWPDDVKRPRRFVKELSSVNRRVDLVLSRIDAETL